MCSKPVPSWKKTLIIGLFGFLATMMTVVGFSPLLPDIQQHFAMTYSQLGLFSGMTGIIAIIAGIPLGLFNRRFGLKKAILTGMLFMAGGMTVVAVAPEFHVAIVGRIFWVVGIQMSYIAFIAMFNTIAPRSSNAKVMTIAYCANNFAAMIGAPVGSSLGEYFGWHISMFFYIVITLMFFLVILFFLRIETPDFEKKSDSGEQGAGIRRRSMIFKNPILIYLGILTCLIIFPPYQEYIPSVLEEVGYGTAFRGHIFMWAYALGIPILIFSGALADKFTPKKVLTITLIFFAAITPLLNTGSQAVVLFSSIFLLAFSSIPVSLAYTIPGLLFKKEDMGFVMGVIQAIGASGSYLGPQLSGILRDYTGSFVWVWNCSALLNFIACVMLLLICVRIRKRREKGI